MQYSLCIRTRQCICREERIWWKLFAKLRNLDYNYSDIIHSCFLSFEHRVFCLFYSFLAVQAILLSLFQLVSTFFAKCVCPTINYLRNLQFFSCPFYKNALEQVINSEETISSYQINLISAEQKVCRVFFIVILCKILFCGSFVHWKILSSSFRLWKLYPTYLSTLQRKSKNSKKLKCSDMHNMYNYSWRQPLMLVLTDPDIPPCRYYVPSYFTCYPNYALINVILISYQ